MSIFLSEQQNNHKREKIVLKNFCYAKIPIMRPAPKRDSSNLTLKKKSPTTPVIDGEPGKQPRIKGLVDPPRHLVIFAEQNKIFKALFKAPTCCVSEAL